MSINIIKIINEEVKKFDFLGNDEILKEQEVSELLMNENLQKQFICDSLLKRTDKVKTVDIVDSFITGDWEDGNDLSVEYSLNMQYVYDSAQEPLSFNLVFYGDKVNINVDGWSDSGRFGGTVDTDIEPSGESWFSIFDWNDIDVNIYTMDGDEIKFTAFENAPPKIQMLFVREFLESFIEAQTLEIKTQDMKIKSQDIPYC